MYRLVNDTSHDDILDGLVIGVNKYFQLCLILNRFLSPKAVG